VEETALPAIDNRWLCGTIEEQCSWIQTKEPICNITSVLLSTPIKIKATHSKFKKSNSTWVI
jgi:hypothetical protein